MQKTAALLTGRWPLVIAVIFCGYSFLLLANAFRSQEQLVAVANHRLVAENKRHAALLKDRIIARHEKADEVAKAMVWLATDCPEYINGTCIDINNGAFPR